MITTSNNKSRTKILISLLLLQIYNYLVITNAFYNTINLSRTRTTGRISSSSSSSSSLFWNGKINHHGPFINKPIALSRSLHLSSSVAAQQEEKEETASSSSSSIGTLVSYETSTNGNNGIAIVQLNVNDSSLGDDYTGRSVQLHIENDSDNSDNSSESGIANGIVLIQRTPYLFIYYKDNDMHKLFTSDVTYDNVKVILSSSKQCINYDVTNTTNNNVLDYPTLISSSSSNKQQEQASTRELYANIPNVGEIDLINTPCLTGFTSIDTMCPIGKGQNMLFISNDDTIKRNIIYDIINTQQQRQNKQENMKIIYALTSHDTSTDKQIILDGLVEKSLLDDIIFVTTEDNGSSSSSIDHEKKDNKDSIVSAAEGICIALSSCSIAELYARRTNDDDNDTNTTPKDVLIIIDTIHPFKVLWDYTTKYLLQLQEQRQKDNANDTEFDEEQAMIASKSSDSEMRSYFSNIIQRSCNLKNNVGVGGSISLLMFAQQPTNEQQNDDNSYSYTMDDFETTIFNNDSNNEKLKQRIQILLDRNIPLTISNCQKLDIPVPPIHNDDSIIRYNQYKTSLKFIDDLISMTDGQIYLDTTTATTNANTKQNQSSSLSSFKRPKYPPINIQKSLTRIGIGKDTPCRADAKVIQKISSGLRLELLYGLDNIDDLTKKKRIRYQAYLNIMEQSKDDDGSSSIRSLVDSVILILAVKLGFMDAYVVQDIEENNNNTTTTTIIGNDLLQYVKNDKSTESILKVINDTCDFSNDIEDEKILKDCITSFFSSR